AVLGPFPPPADSPEFAALLEWETGEDEVHVARTVDGWNLHLYRYLPHVSDADAPTRPPVVLGHGLCGSRYIFDVHPDYSLARFLAAEGFDVWLLDLRGRNESWPDGGPDPALQWTFDDFVEHDIPAATEAVCAAAGSDTCFWIGTEMSGIALYAVAIAGTAPRIRAGVTMGSPVVTPPTGEVPGVTTAFPEAVGSRYPFSMASAFGPAMAAAGSDMLESSFRPVNTDWTVTARYFRYGVPDEATGIVEQFRDWMAAGSMHSVDRSLVYSDRLAEFTLPVLMLAGASDRQRPPAAVEDAFGRIGSEDKTFVRLGVDAGFAVDYGHDDVVAGYHAPAEVFPRVAAWLDERS
ncbi:MAG: hypothetical protein JWL73_1822, partial [Actinomycetia bacterium]|nr:hypothetical protein [Actinomycetes bacterium]